MATREWLRAAHQDGYDSGEILPKEPDARRAGEEAKIGGSYHEVFEKAIRPFVAKNARVLELGPGRGSWTRALLHLTPHGEVHTLDLHDVNRFMDPADWGGRLHHHQVTQDDYSFLPDDHFDFFFSFGVLCHLARAERGEVLAQALPKVKPSAYAVHEYGDWKKLDEFGWAKGGIPENLKNFSDDDSWWPRNDATDMALTAYAAGWEVVEPDLGLLKRDGLIVLRRPGKRA